MTSTPYFLIRIFKHPKVRDVQTSEVDSKLEQSTWGDEILYDDKYLKDEQLFSISYL
jgi:hypothetical protein